MTSWVVEGGDIGTVTLRRDALVVEGCIGNGVTCILPGNIDRI